MKLPWRWRGWSSSMVMVLALLMAGMFISSSLVRDRTPYLKQPILSPLSTPSTADQLLLRDALAKLDSQSALLQRQAEESAQLKHKIGELERAHTTTPPPPTTPASYFPVETLLIDPSRARVVTNHTTHPVRGASIDAYPMCQHPRWGKPCQVYKDSVANGQREYRHQQHLQRTAAAPHAMCPKLDEPVVVQLSGLCYWNEFVHVFKNTRGCPVKCEAVNQRLPALPNAHVFLEQCDISPSKPAGLNGIWGALGLELNPGNTLAVDYMQRDDFKVNWVRNMADVYINYMYAWVNPCGHPRDWRSSPCRPSGRLTSQDLRGKQLAATFISNCNGALDRLDYVRELTKWVHELSKGERSVTNYGQCDRTADAVQRLEQEVRAQHKSLTRADKKVLGLKQHKFVLSFENSIRPDYLTEKLLESGMAGVVPVVWGAPLIEDFAPGGEGSFVNALEYSSPYDLAVRLLQLDADDEAYLKLLDWRLRDELHPTFVEQARYSIENAGADGFVCRTCQFYLQRFCHRNV